MCTLSWIREPGGYRLFFNRDERPSRAPGLPPMPGKTEYLYWLAPRDGESQGTWIGVNEAGVSLALLNRYHDSPVGGNGPWTSRGLLVSGLLHSMSITGVRLGLEQLDRAAYQPFTLVAFEPDKPAQLFAWNGRELTEDAVEDTGLVATSSGANQEEAARVRGELFARRRELFPALDDAALFEALHASHWPASGPYSVCMHRPEASTVSFTRIDVLGDSSLMTYVPGPPGETAERGVTRFAHATG